MTEPETRIVEPPSANGPAGPLPASPLLAGLAEAFPEVEFGVSGGQDVARVPAGRMVEFVGAAREAGFQMFVDLTAVDYLPRRPRYEVVVSLLALAPATRLRIRVDVPGDVPEVPSISGIYPGANFFEREVYDLFGIVFTGHPDLTRLLMPDDWEGHPLRKDYPVGAVPVQFRDAPRMQ